MTEETPMTPRQAAARIVDMAFGYITLPECAKDDRRWLQQVAKIAGPFASTILNDAVEALDTESENTLVESGDEEEDTDANSTEEELNHDSERSEEESDPAA